MRELVLTFMLSCTGIYAQNSAVVEVNPAKVVHSIPRTIFGTFLEPIGRSTYGGLWAQVLDNPSFEENLWSAPRVSQMIAERPELAEASRIILPLPWQPLDGAQGNRYELRWGDAANSSRSLMLMALPGKQTGVRQMIYLPVHRVLRYTGSIYAKPVSGAREIEVSLRRRDRQDEVFAKQTIPLTSAAWTRYEFSFQLAATALASREPADFVVAVSDEGRVLIDQAFLYPADHIDGMNPEMIELARAMKAPLIRFGGNFTSAYHWRDGIGPIDKRVSMLNQAWGIPEYNHFGTDELLRFCRLLGAEPQIALNLGSGTPEEAADWVRYVDEKWGKPSGGLLWELDNELWGTFQVGYPTLFRIAARTQQFGAAVRKADPNARLIATGQDPDRFQDWNAAQLSLGPDAYNYLSTHFVVRTADVVRANPSREFIAEAALALPTGLERRLREMKKQIDGNPATRERVKIAFTEWLFTGPVSGSPMFDNLGGALCTAGFLNTLMRVADFTSVADMTGTIEFGGIWQKRGRVYGVPAYWAFRMYSTADSSKLVESSVKGGQYDIAEGVRRIPDIPSVPYLDVVSALNEAGDKLTLFCVNRHLTREIRAAVRFPGFTAQSARGQQLSATSLYAVNDEVRPDAIVPVDLSLQVRGTEFEHIFPRSSVTVIEISRR